MQGRCVYMETMAFNSLSELAATTVAAGYTVRTLSEWLVHTGLKTVLTDCTATAEKTVRYCVCMVHSVPTPGQAHVTLIHTWNADQCPSILAGIAADLQTRFEFPPACALVSDVAGVKTLVITLLPPATTPITYGEAVEQAKGIMTKPSARAPVRIPFPVPSHQVIVDFVLGRALHETIVAAGSETVIVEGSAGCHPNEGALSWVVSGVTMVGSFRWEWGSTDKAQTLVLKFHWPSADMHRVADMSADAMVAAGFPFSAVAPYTFETAVGGLMDFIVTSFTGFRVTLPCAE